MELPAAQSPPASLLVYLFANRFMYAHPSLNDPVPCTVVGIRQSELLPTVLLTSFWSMCDLGMLALEPARAYGGQVWVRWSAEAESAAQPDTIETQIYAAAQNCSPEGDTFGAVLESWMARQRLLGWQRPESSVLATLRSNAVDAGYFVPVRDGKITVQDEPRVRELPQGALVVTVAGTQYSSDCGKIATLNEQASDLRRRWGSFRETEQDLYGQMCQVVNDSLRAWEAANARMQPGAETVSGSPDPNVSNILFGLPDLFGCLLLVLCPTVLLGLFGLLGRLRQN